MQAPLRQKADNAFQSGDLDFAIQAYRESIAAREDGLLYTYLNLACALICLSDASQDESISLLIKSLACRSQDECYFSANIKSLCFRLFVLNREEEAEAVLTLAGLRKVVPQEGSQFLFVPGFPRCGTTTIATILAESGIAVDSISPEPYTYLIASSKTYQEQKRIVHSSYWGKSVPGPSKIYFVEKSTHWLLSRFHTEMLMSLAENPLVLICTRNPVNRSFSAFKFGCDIGMNLSLENALEAEARSIQELGGVKAIYSSGETFSGYLTMLEEKGVKLPIIYPSLIMKHFSDFAPAELLKRATFFNVDTKKLSGRELEVSLSGLICQSTRRVNRSKSLIAQEDQGIDIIDSWLKRLEHF
jgi:hypothetical protein